MSPPTLIIDRHFKGVGRLKLRTGSMRETVRTKINRMLDALAEDGRLDVLRALRDLDLTLTQVREAYQHKALDALPLGETSKPLFVAMRAWIESEKAAGGSAKHASSRETSVRYLERVKREKGKTEPLISDIPALLMELRRTLGRKHARSFNVTRSAASAFVRQLFMRNHPLYQATIAVELLPEKETKKPNPFTLKEMRHYFPSPATDPVDAIAWGMATTGMGPGEYWGAWSVRSDRVRIVGTKTEYRFRDVPLIMAPAVPAMHRRTFEDKLRDRTERAHEPYDLRRTFSNEMEAAGILRTRRKMYMGHSAGDVTGGYERHEVDAFLASDGEKLRAHYGVTTAPALTLHAKAR